MKRAELTGQRFGRFTVIGLGKVKKNCNGNNVYYWECKCDCGNTRYLLTNTLTSGISKSCGCLQRELQSQKKRTHGESKTLLFNKWRKMKDRCECPTHQAYKDYGGRGIKVCDEWQKFENFRDWAYGNGYQEKLTLDRIDVNGNYEPSNCRWTTWKAQANNRRSNHRVTAYGETHTIQEWSDITGIKHSTIWRRLCKPGWSAEDAVSKPLLRRRNA